MKTLLSLFIIFYTLSSKCFSQVQYNWNEIKKVELYSLPKPKYGKANSSKEMNTNTFIKCESKIIASCLKEIENCKFDALSEEKVYALRVYFSKFHKDFLLLIDQGIMFEMEKWKCFKIIKSDELKEVVEKSIKKNGL